MQKKQLLQLLDEIFIPLEFKRKGNNWINIGEELCKVINLQKSNYSNSYYINYGFIIKCLDLTTTTHIEDRLSSTNKDEQKKITELLDLDSNMDFERRKLELTSVINEKIVMNINLINGEEDLLQNLRNRTHLNDIPMIVKQYFKLLDD